MGSKPPMPAELKTLGWLSGADATSCAFLAMGVQKHYNKRFPKKSCRKVCTKQPTKKKNIFFLDLFYHVFGQCFSARGVQRHDKKVSKKILANPGTGTFLASEEPTNHVGVRHFFLE
jgi:hypothetical protein